MESSNPLAVTLLMSQIMKPLGVATPCVELDEVALSMVYFITSNHPALRVFVHVRQTSKCNALVTCW